MAALLYSISALLLAFSIGLAAYLLARLQRRAQMQRRLRLALIRTPERKRDDAVNWENPLTKIGALWLRNHRADKQIVRLLEQAGWHRHRDQAVYFGVQIVLPAVAVAAVLLFWITVSAARFDFRFVIVLFGAFAGGFLLPRMALRRWARRRLGRARDEVQMLAQLLKVLFEAGLGLDQALLTIATEHADMIPELARELRPVLRQVRRGADRSQALAEMARLLDIQDLNGLITLLRQVDRYGGNVQQPLRSFVDLLDEQRRQEIQEHVGKLSGAMTVVMVMFLFPALLVFLAGPGFIAVVRMLMSLGG